jgi:hypothetical protein
VKSADGVEGAGFGDPVDKSAFEHLGFGSRDGEPIAAPANNSVDELKLGVLLEGDCGWGEEVDRDHICGDADNIIHFVS